MISIHSHRSQFGFTIIEAMIVVAIGAILAMVAFPNFSELIQDNCLTTSNNNLITSLQRARSEAIKRNTTVSVNADSNNANEWAGGWSLFLDEDSNSNGTLDANEDYNGDGILATGANPRDWALIQSTSLSCGDTTITSTAAAFRYTSEGFINTAGRFDICDNRANEMGRRIEINTVGRPNTKRNQCP